jgi:alpha-amylase
MMDLRATHVFGPQHDYFDDPDVVGWTLEGDEAHGNNGLAVVLTNRTGGDKAMFVGTQHAGEVWTDALGNQPGEVAIDQEGYGVFSCADGSVSIWIRRTGENEEAAQAVETVKAEETVKTEKKG